MKEHNNDEGGLFECRHCQLEFGNMILLKEHMKKHVKVRYVVS